MDFVSQLFDASDFPPRWRCGHWTELQGWLYIVADLGIWSAYFAIPLVLGYYLFRRRDLPFRGIFLLFVSFILLCGTTHLIDAILFWWPAYRLAGLIEIITAIVSWITVFALFRVTPSVLAMRSPEELQREIAARRQAEERLHEANSELEKRVELRTAELTAAVSALKAERELLSTTLASIGDAVIVTDTASRVTFMNAVAEGLTGWQAAESRNLPLSEILQTVDETTRQSVDNPAVQALCEGGIVAISNRAILVAKDGTERPIDESAAPIRSEQGDVGGAVVVFRDMSERKQHEVRMAGMMQRLTTLVDNTPLAVVEWDNEYRVRRWSGQAEKVFGWKADEVMGKQVFEFPLVHEDDRPMVEVAMERLGDPSDRLNVTLNRNLTKSGQVLFCRWYNSVLHDDAGQMVAVLSLVLDSTEQIKAEEALREADRRKDEFLATLSHELRNPLAPIRNAIQILRQRGPSEPQIERLQNMVERQVNHMVRLLDDLLEVSRITRGMIQLQKQPIDLSAVVQNAVETSAPMIESGNHDLILAVPSEPLLVEGDSVRLTQVLTNLLNNAAKYTPDGGRIRITLDREGDRGVIRVRDNGPGIPADMLTRIFDLFTQVKDTRQRSQGGLGIGLAIVKRLVEMHGGKVVARIDPTVSGAEFVIDLPLIETKDHPNGESDALTLEARCSKCRVLVVDDNEDAADSLSLLLSMEGHEVCTAYDGESGIALAITFRPDVIFLDLGMPGMDGIETAKKVRELQALDGVILIALTGWGQEQDRRRTLAAGFNGHLVKPVALPVLQQTLANAFIPNNNQ